MLCLSAVSATPTRERSVIPPVQTCTTSWTPGESDPHGITGHCEYEGVNCNTGLSVIPTAEFGETTCTSRKRFTFSLCWGNILVLTWLLHAHGKEYGKPTPSCFLQVKCGYLDQGHCQNREKTCVGGSYTEAAGHLLVALFLCFPWGIFLRKTDTILIGTSVVPEGAIVASHRIQTIFSAMEEEVGGIW